MDLPLDFPFYFYFSFFRYFSWTFLFGRILGVEQSRRPVLRLFPLDSRKNTLHSWRILPLTAFLLLSHCCGLWNGEKSPLILSITLSSIIHCQFHNGKLSLKSSPSDRILSPESTALSWRYYHHHLSTIMNKFFIEKKNRQLQQKKTYIRTTVFKGTNSNVFSRRDSNLDFCSIRIPRVIRQSK